MEITDETRVALRDSYEMGKMMLDDVYKEYVAVAEKYADNVKWLESNRYILDGPWDANISLNPARNASKENIAYLLKLSIFGLPLTDLLDLLKKNGCPVVESKVMNDLGALMNKRKVISIGAYYKWISADTE